MNHSDDLPEPSKDPCKPTAKECWDFAERRYRYTPQIFRTDSYFVKLGKLKQYYTHFHKISGVAPSGKLYYDPYPYDWAMILTPIEMDAWCSIRSKGRMVLYPQYPVLNYFIDFANPFLKIGLELDGKDYHDEAKDRKRDRMLHKEGWTIIRITGSEMNRTPKEIFWDVYEDIGRNKQNAIDWILNTGDGVIQAIGMVYFWNYKSKRSNNPDEQYRLNFMLNLAYETLISHIPYQPTPDFWESKEAENLEDDYDF